MLIVLPAAEGEPTRTESGRYENGHSKLEFQSVRIRNQRGAFSVQKTVERSSPNG